jgi:hypothetical protein
MIIKNTLSYLTWIGIAEVSRWMAAFVGGKIAGVVDFLRVMYFESVPIIVDYCVWLLCVPACSVGMAMLSLLLIRRPPNTGLFVCVYTVGVGVTVLYAATLIAGKHGVLDAIVYAAGGLLSVALVAISLLGCWRRRGRVRGGGGLARTGPDWGQIA